MKTGILFVCLMISSIGLAESGAFGGLSLFQEPELKPNQTFTVTATVETCECRCVANFSTVSILLGSTVATDLQVKSNPSMREFEDRQCVVLSNTYDGEEFEPTKNAALAIGLAQFASALDGASCDDSCDLKFGGAWGDDGLYFNTVGGHRLKKSCKTETHTLVMEAHCRK